MERAVAHINIELEVGVKSQHSVKVEGKSTI